MQAQSPAAPPEVVQWLGEGWMASLAQVLEAMAGERPQAAWAGPATPAAEPATEGAAVCWQQPYDLAADACMWIVVPEPVWRAIGSRALGAAGVEETAEAELRGTCLEILAQASAALARTLGERIGRVVTAVAGREVEGCQATALGGGSVQVGYPDSGPQPVTLAYSQALVESLARPEPSPQAPQPDGAAQPEDEPAAPVSATLELLRDVELPVSISFGRAQMLLQDALRLTAGSIIELDRSISEPVSLIVNNTVVALGEVVVIEGNYGVRIREIMSREKLLRSSGLT